MHQIFGCNHNLSDISGIANWNTGSVTTLVSAFAYTGITNVDALSGWNVENVTDMSRLFEKSYSHTDISGIQG